MFTFMCLIKFRNFSATMSCDTLSGPLLSPSSGLSWCICSSTWKCPTGPLGSVHFSLITFILISQTPWFPVFSLPSSLILLPFQICVWISVVNFSFQLLDFSAPRLLFDQKQQSGQRSLIFGGQGSFCPPWLPLCVSCSGNTCTAACQVAEAMRNG